MYLRNAVIKSAIKKGVDEMTLRQWPQNADDALPPGGLVSWQCIGMLIAVCL